MGGKKEYEVKNDVKIKQIKIIIACKWGIRLGVESKEIETKVQLITP